MFLRTKVPKKVNDSNRLIEITEHLSGEKQKCGDLQILDLVHTIIKQEK